MSAINRPGETYFAYQSAHIFGERDDSTEFRGWSLLMGKPMTGGDVASPDVYYYNATWPGWGPAVLINYLNSRGLHVISCTQVPFQHNEEFIESYHKWIADGSPSNYEECT